MDNREILEKYKSSNDKYDEGQQYFEGKADTIGFIVTVLIGIMIGLYNRYKGISSYDLFAAITLGEGISNLYRYYKNHRTKVLIIGLILLVFGIYCLIRHIKLNLG